MKLALRFVARLKSGSSMDLSLLYSNCKALENVPLDSHRDHFLYWVESSNIFYRSQRQMYSYVYIYIYIDLGIYFDLHMMESLCWKSLNVFHPCKNLLLLMFIIVMEHIQLISTSIYWQEAQLN